MYCQPSSSQFNESLTDDFINVGILKFTDLRKVVIVAATSLYWLLSSLLQLRVKNLGQDSWDKLQLTEY